MCRHLITAHENVLLPLANVEEVGLGGKHKSNHIADVGSRINTSIAKGRSL